MFSSPLSTPASTPVSASPVAASPVTASGPAAWLTAPGVATLTVVFASIALGSAALFVRPLRDAGIAPASLAFFRYAITAVVLLRSLNLAPGKRQATYWGLVGGAAAGLGWIAYANSLGNVNLATTGVAYMTYPIFSLISCRLLFGERAGLRTVLGGLLVVLAAAIALGPTALLDVSPALFIAPATFGFSIAVLTERLGPLNPSERLSAVAAGATVALAPLVLSLPTEHVLPANLSAWALLIGIALGCGLLPMWIYGAAAPLIGSARTSVAGTAELPTMFVIGALVFGEAIEPSHLLAGAIILGSITLTPNKQKAFSQETTGTQPVKPLRTASPHTSNR